MAVAELDGDLISTEQAMLGVDNDEALPLLLMIAMSHWPVSRQIHR
jgi:hypothetical protein